ncbi:MAG TPA: adenylate/guanylate cyclase domain-containing protein [Gaiellaceae bacterium]|nr:adenylate/guanylate cyclase domain-containing protein [Gaiellaceae bacterium]
MRGDLPTGTLTFLFTDVEGSTKLLHELGAEAYADALADHRRVIRKACAAAGGIEVDTQGDAFFFAFPTAPGALAAAAALTEALASEAIHVRVGLHTGTPLVTDEGYVGDDVHRAARIAAVGHGGQVLVASSTAALVGLDGLVDLGEHRFKDLPAPERVYQLGDAEFPPLKSLYRSNLPLAANPLVGRKKELADVLKALVDGSRAVTVTGPGGVGKTRFALAVAGEAAHAFPDGVWFVPLSSLRDPTLVLPTVADAIGADGEVARHIGDSQCLLFLDNFEQIVDAASELAVLAGECPRLRLLITSREALRIAVEREYPLSPLPESPSVELFRQRAAAVAPEFEIEYATAAAICDRLDRLPLAIELAAARCKALSPEQILDRLSASLDLLRGGRDADPRQQTLRATIEWSYNLLSGDEQRLVRALSVFRGGCTLEAAEAVCHAGIDTLQSLVEKSLLRFSGERYWLLETIREYTRARLAETAEADRLAERHARFYLARLEGAHSGRMGPRRGEILAWYRQEADNVRAMLDRLTDASPVDAARAAYLLHRYWTANGAYGEERERIQTIFARAHLPDESRGDLLVLLSETENRLGNLSAGKAALDEALLLTAKGSASRVVALQLAAWTAVNDGDADEGVRLSRQAASEAEAVDAVTRVNALGDLGQILGRVGRPEEARPAMERAVDEARRHGFPMFVIFGEADLGMLDLRNGAYESAQRTLASGLAQLRELGIRHYPYEVEVLTGLGWSQLGQGQRDEARRSFSELLELVTSANHRLHPDLLGATTAIALAADPDDFERAARLLGAVAKLTEDAEFESALWNSHDELERRFEQLLIGALGEATYAAQRADGARMSAEEAIEQARSLAAS